MFYFILTAKTVAHKIDAKGKLRLTLNTEEIYYKN
jgi:hypothetical protein